MSHLKINFKKSLKIFISLYKSASNKQKHAKSSEWTVK